MTEKQWGGRGPNGEIVSLDDDKLIVVESGEVKIRLGYWCEGRPAKLSGGILSQMIQAEEQRQPYLYLHVEIPESERKVGSKGKKERWASSEKVPPPFCSWPKELQLSVAQWILSIAGPEDLVSQLSVESVSLRHIFLSGFFILLNVPAGVEI